MTVRTKPAFPTVSLIVQAAMAAVFLVGVTGAATAQAVISDDGGLVEWTIAMDGVSTAPVVSAVPITGLNNVFPAYNNTWTNGSGVTLHVAASGWGGTAIGAYHLTTPAGGMTDGNIVAVTSAGYMGSTDTATLTLPAAQQYFGAMVNAFAGSYDTLSFYNGSALCRATINVRIRDNQDERAFRLWRLREGGARPEAPEPESSAPTSCLGTGTVW